MFDKKRNKKIKNKKSQIQLAESIAVIIIVIFLLVIGVVFWNGIQKEDYLSSAEEYQDLSVIALAKTVSELPELRCYNDQDTPEVNCFDWFKILALNKSMHDPATKQATFDFYNNYFKNSRITIKQVYPEEINVTIYDNNISSKRSLQISIPIVIEKNYGRLGKKGFGLIVVEGYFR